MNPSPAPTAALPRLLLVEDSAFFRGVVAPMLSAAGYQVTAVANGAEALRLRETEEGFDAIVSDIEMPELGGIELARTLRQGGAWSGLPMIALSSRTTPEAIRQAREAGFTDYIGKLDREGLLASLRQCLGTPTQMPAMAMK